MEALKVREIVTALRTRLNDGRYLLPVTKQQQETQKEAKNTEPIWLCPFEFPIPEEDNIRDTVLGVIKDLGDGHETFAPVEIVAVKVEWVGYRRATQLPSPALSTEERYRMLEKDLSSEAVLLFVHGGAF